jgi:hypothetical protein
VILSFLRSTDPPFQAPQETISTPSTSYTTTQPVSRSDSISSIQPSNPTPPTNLAARRAPTPLGSSSSNDIVVPNKSTLVMEEPSGGYGGSSNGSGGGRRDSFSSQPGFGGMSKGGYGQQPQQHQQQQSLGGGAGGVERNNDYEQEALASNGSGPGGLGGNASRNPSRVSETSSVGTRFIGGYAGSMAASEAGGRRSVSFTRRCRCSGLAKVLTIGRT